MSVTVQLLGGLGNQLFQSAYGLALKARGYDVQFCREHLQQSGHKIYSLHHFEIQQHINVIDHTEMRHGIVVSEDGMPFKPEMLYPSDPSVIYGYFQTEKYFKEIENQIRTDFSPAVSPPFEIAALGRKMRSESSVAIHVRRGDYVGLQHFHGLMPLEYYWDAFDLIEEQQGPIKSYIFSDDIEWCKLNFSGQYISTGSKLWDLWLFSQCRHAICANSSYSWWGSWLGDDKVCRTVVAPKNWFVDKNTDSCDIIPDRWLKI